LEKYEKSVEIHKQTTSKQEKTRQIMAIRKFTCALLSAAACLPGLSYLLGLKVRSITKHRPDLLYASLLHTSALFTAQCAHCSRTNLKGVSKINPV